MLKGRVFVAGGAAPLGRALRQRLTETGCFVVGAPPDEPELTCASEVRAFFQGTRPDYIFLVAGQSGGIRANLERPAELMLDNLLTATNVIHQAHLAGVRKLLYLASSCSYPRAAPQPLATFSLMDGPLEASSAPYATAKLAGWQLCQAHRRQYRVSFITAVPANAFGPFDDFGVRSGHVIPALMRRLHAAKQRGDGVLTVWGTGRARREFLYLPDLADACLFVMDRYDADEPINLGLGTELSVGQLAEQIAQVVGYRGRLVFDPSWPEGALRKVLDARPLSALGWRPTTDFYTALQDTYAWFLAHEARESDVRAAV